MNGKKIIIHILFDFCLFSFGLNQALSSENNITNYRATISVLQELYRAEITASKTYSGFAQKAVEEKYYSVARLFSALSESESIHGRNFKKILNDLGVDPENFPEPDIKVGDTKKNLKWALKVELSEIDTETEKTSKNGVNADGKKRGGFAE